MGAYSLPLCACQPCALIDGCSATNLWHNLLWTGLAVPISSKGGALDVPHLDVRIGHGRAGIPAVARVFELTVRPYFQQLFDYFKSTGRRSKNSLNALLSGRCHASNSAQTGVVTVFSPAAVTAATLEPGTSKAGSGLRSRALRVCYAATRSSPLSVERSSFKSM